jgi:hypothetical protein
MNHTRKTYGGVEAYRRSFLLRALDGEWSAKHPDHFYTCKKIPSTHLDGRQGRHQSRTESCEEKKNSCTFRESNPDLSPVQTVI